MRDWWFSRSTGKRAEQGELRLSGEFDLTGLDQVLPMTASVDATFDLPASALADDEPA